MLLMLGGATAPGSLELSFETLRSTKGLIRICLTADPASFPDCTRDRAAVMRSISASETGTRFAGLPSGDYAVAVIHDENGNARLDTFAGIPREGIGFSRNPAVTFGPPRFAAARFTIGDVPARQNVRMRYFL